MTKKGILEKLGLIEAVEEKVPNLENVEKFESKKVNNESENEVKKNPLIVEQFTSEIEDKLDVLIESYEKNKFLTIDEIYSNKKLDKDIKQTVFIAEVFMKALPENLPIDIKRKSIINILEASELKKDDLLNDAYIRIDALNTILEETVSKTAEIKKKNEITIKELNARIDMLRRNSEERFEFEEKQSTTVEYEIQRIINIVDAIK